VRYRLKTAIGGFKIVDAVPSNNPKSTMNIPGRLVADG
jgi:hypothetical protein